MVPAKKCSTANASILLYLMYKTNRSVALSTAHFLQRTRHRPWRGWSTILEGSGAVHMLDAKFHQCVDGYVAVCLVLTRDVYAIVKISQLMAKKFFISFVPWSGNVFEVGLDVLLVDRKSRSVTGNCVVVSVVVLAHHRRLVVQGIDVRGAVCGCRCQRRTC